jgi:hypothetical protein
MKSNRRQNFALATEEEFGCGFYGPRSVSAAVAYFARWAVAHRYALRKMQ